MTNLIGRMEIPFHGVLNFGRILGFDTAISGLPLLYWAMFLSLRLLRAWCSHDLLILAKLYYNYSKKFFRFHVRARPM